MGPASSGWSAAHQHDLPARLAIADQAGLALRRRVPGGHLRDEPRFGVADVLDGLARHRLRQKSDEIAGMSRGKGDADLAVMLHAADAGAVAGAGIEHDEGALARIRHDAFRRQDPHQGIIYRAGQAATVQNHLHPEGEDVGGRARFHLEIVVAALA